ncbi:MAG: hypothetical protein WA628_21575 [Terriglobales bacterium]
MIFYLPILLMIVGTTTYHIAQKSVPTEVNPLFSLAINYLTALAGTVLLIPLYRNGQLALGPSKTSTGPARPSAFPS